MRFRNSFHPYAAVTIFFWSLSYVFTRLTLQYFSAMSLGFFRYLIASCTLIVIVAVKKIKLPHREDFLWFLAAGGTGFFLYVLAFNQGQVTVTAATASVVIATVPVMTALLARFVYGERLRMSQWAAIFLEFAGVAVLTLMEGVFSVNTGLCWLLFAAVVLSVYNLLQRKLTKRYTALQTSAYSIFLGTLLLTVFAPRAMGELPGVPAVQFFYLAVLGVGSSAIAYICWAEAFARAKQTSQVSNYMFITPLLTSVLGFLVAGEVPDRATLLGGGIILVGVLVFNFGHKLCELFGIEEK